MPKWQGGVKGLGADLPDRDMGSVGVQRYSFDFMGGCVYSGTLATLRIGPWPNETGII